YEMLRGLWAIVNWKESQVSIWVLWLSFFVESQMIQYSRNIYTREVSLHAFKRIYNNFHHFSDNI
ncbi:hypothetical protein ACWH9Q_21755, partial [Bacillus subtilis]